MGAAVCTAAPSSGVTVCAAGARWILRGHVPAVFAAFKISSKFVSQRASLDTDYRRLFFPEVYMEQTQRAEVTGCT